VFPLNLYARVRFVCCFCTRDRGCGVHPVFPAPSSFLRANELQNSGESRRENAESHPVWKLNAERLFRRPGIARKGPGTHRNRHPEVRALSCAPRRMAARTALNTILRGAQERAPQDDVEIASQDRRPGRRDKPPHLPCPLLNILRAFDEFCCCALCDHDFALLCCSDAAVHGCQSGLIGGSWPKADAV
jgi:hypothetical protein